MSDHQGIVRAVIDNSILLNRIVDDSFGQVTSETNPDFDFRFGYTGREQDDATGLMHYRTRYYDPAVGRFISEDSLGFAAGDANLYRYVFNSPTNYTDPTGEAVALGAAAGIALPVVLIGAGLILLNNQLQPEEDRLTIDDLGDAAQWCWETVTGGYNPDLDPNRPNRDMPVEPAT
ncbi:MAG: RHS repeat-associated core domain-containing protein [Leptolyngbya sp. SIOISBB]|nr:RHS repeat-associated core domain-containing protein [Leptolyngbya sp. SIOISBB]